MRARAVALSVISACLFGAPAASAGPSTTLFYNDANAAGAAGNAGNFVTPVSQSWGHRLRRVDVSGTVTAILPNIRTSELRLKITPPAGMGSAFTFTPTAQDFVMIPGQMYRLEGFAALPAGWDAEGMFSLEAHMNFDHGSGVDVRWESLSATLTTAAMPPVIAPAHDLGVLGSEQTLSTSLANFGTLWVRFTIPKAVGQAHAPYYLDIDTVGTMLWHHVAQQNDPQMWLFDASGHLLAVSADIDAAAGNRQDLMSFGMQQRPGSPLVAADKVGRCGSLDEGTYYLLLMADDPSVVAANGFTALPSAPPFGPVTLNFRTNFPSRCDADFNRSGGVSVQDIYDFLAAWTAGCP